MDDSTYLSSTQHRYFTFTPKALATLRESTSTLSHATPSTSPPLTASEELTLLTYYTTVLSSICTHFQTSSTVRATALTFLARLYLRISPSTVHPKTLLLPLLYLSLKSELGGQSTSWFIRTAAELKLNTTKEELLAPEIMVAMNLRWSFLVRHPWRGLEGVKAELLGLLAGTYKGPRHNAPAALQRDRAAVEKACAIARTTLTNKALFGDAQFLYTPPQVMLAALRQADREVAEFWVCMKFTDPVRGKLLQTIRECEEGTLTEGERKGLLRRPVMEVTQELRMEAKRIDKKLFFWKEGKVEKKREGEGDGGSAEEEERRAKKRKVEEERRQEDAAVFGGKLG